jgi:thymidylate kinase
MVIFEGSDATGKSTLELELQNRLNWDIIKGSSFELAKCTNDELFNHFKEVTLNNPNAIIDRWAISNYIYADIFKDYTRITDQQLQYLESLIEANNDTLVYVRADPEVVKHRLRQRGDEYIEEDDVDSIIEAYDNLFHNAKFKYIEIDTSTGTDPSILADFLVNKIK